jgi:PAS domain S-box-containing protein
VESEKLDDFNEEDRKLLEIFAEHVASAISGHKEEAEHRRYEQSLEALHRHASELQLAGNVQQVCELTLDAMEQALDFKDASFLFVEKGVLKEKGVRGTPILDISLPLDGKGITVKAANTRRTVLVNDLRGDPDFVRGPIDSLSELATPVLIDGETVAVLNVVSLDLNAFTREDQRLLETLSQHVASALSRLGDVEMVRASEERYRTFLESSRDAVFVFDDNVCIYVNRATVDMLGYDSPEEIIGLPPYSIVAPEEREEEMRRTAARARGEAVPSRYEVRLLRRDGGVVPCEANVSMIMYEGKPVSLSVTRDITERKKIEEQLREAPRAPSRKSKMGEGTTFTVVIPERKNEETR